MNGPWRVRSLAALVAGAVCVGCGSDTVTPTSASSTDAVESTSRLFTGTLGVGETQFYSFTINQDSEVFLTLGSVVPPDGRAASGESLGLSFGVPRGTGCQMSTTITTQAGLSAQIREYATKGVKCVAVFDPGTLTSTMNFAIRIGYFQ